MRLITFHKGAEARLGTWIDADRTIVDLGLASALLSSRHSQAFASMQALIEAGPAGLDEARTLASHAPDEARIATAQCRILSPLPRPVQLRDFLCFPDHVRGVRAMVAELAIRDAADPAQKRAQMEAAGYFAVPADYYDFPGYYICNRMSVVGPDEDIVWPTFSGLIDYELEWAAVIGKQGGRISSARANEHIFGYTIFNDWSARDEQVKVMATSNNVGPSAGKDFANTLGPCIVTADEIANPYALSMKAFVNGEVAASGTTASMHYKFEDLIEYLTRGHAVYPGEVLGSGTVGGGCRLENQRPVSPGDVVELEVESIGRLRNRVIAPHIEKSTTGGLDQAMSKALLQVVKR